jgi:hypothetical protein
MDQDPSYEALTKLDPESMPTLRALKYLGQLIDQATDRCDESALRNAVAVGESLQAKLGDTARRATLHYYLANAWAGLRHIRRQTDSSRWEWEQPEAEDEIAHLRMAVQRARRGRAISRHHGCPALTNLGNLMNTVGRFVEAIAYWDEALSIDPAFGMARGNRGVALTYYAHGLNDRRDAALLLRAALYDLREALTQRLQSDARAAFAAVRDRIEKALNPAFAAEAARPEEPPANMRAAEARYRRWSLTRRLFLTPLNDLGESWSAAHDSLTLPTMVAPLDQGPKYPGFFNQMKQEFVSARYLLYEAEGAEGVHFSDRQVLLFNTLDYPAYSLATEKLKCAFRISYSLLDKIAYFVNDYLALGIPDHRVSFRSLWYEQGDRRKLLRPDLRQRENWPLRGLFWLSKDLSEDAPGFREALEPDARDIALIRNHLEHKYLKLHDELWCGPGDADAKVLSFLTDSLAKSMYRSDFAAKTLRLMKAARAALIYLSLAVRREELSRESSRDPSKIIVPNPLDVWEDDWKR